MKTTKFVLFLALALFTVLSACQKFPEQPESSSSPQARHAVQNYTLHALIHGNSQQAYQMDLTLFSDGTTEAMRSIVPFDPNHNYSDCHLIGSTGSTQTGSTIVFNFSTDTWFIPFDEQQSPAMIMAGGGSAGVDCTCDGNGGCNATKTEIGDVKSTSCVPGTCDKNCDGAFSIANGPGNVSGVMIATHAVTEAY